ncbi:hypothetical protein [Phyllobacterium pellucidum]|uniref:hypothetical protein n=1 Tax=Phyllobacterium pellucidum TaxID=2740464 RepID=UPI001D14108A|nr:hypothetical protein [Phyllobacterium sp. T1018]UGY08544.1 hypothetical protein LLE51_010850 [Phyllobacterium sp. T1018]
MSAFYHFHWSREEHADCLVLVTTLASFREQDLIEVVDKDILSGNPYPEALIVIAPADLEKSMAKALKAMIQAQDLIRLPFDTAIVVASFDEQGKVTAPASSVLQGKMKLTAGDFKEIIHSGTHHLVSSRGAVLVAPHAHHFIHPRRKHSRAFFRAANALIQGEEIGFLALALLPYLAVYAEKVWIDSSSIASLVYATCALKSRLSPAATSSIQIQSFLSYEGLDQLWIQDQTKELVLISATASGSLPELVAERTKLPAHRIITLFSTARSISGTVVFDAREATTGLEPLMLETFDDITCPWCQDGFRLITFVGDQFLSDAATISPYTLVETAATPAFKAVMKKYRGQNAFSLRLDREHAGHGLFVDLEHTLLATESRSAISKLVQRNVPASTSHILPTAGEDSKRLAEIVADEIHALGLKRPFVLDISKPDDATRDRKGVVIVAATVSSGQSFQDASRDLRTPFKNLPRTYFAGLSKHSTAEHQGSLLKDLEHNNREYKHTFCAVDAMTLPHQNRYLAWKRELEFWTKVLLDQLKNRADAEVLEFAERRRRTLSNIIVDNDFFLPNTGGHSLELRPSFAFWEPGYGPEIRQGDVFATIANILENRRTPSKTGQAAPLSQSPFHMTVLSSENFTRFNDGIIQASLLRAAFPHELSYADPQMASHSAKIGHLVLKMLERHAENQGEAVLEFLVALATRRMTLATVDLTRVASYAKEMPALLSTILPYVLDPNPYGVGDDTATPKPA